jgi:tetratricopeptide (TPR) repeat protein
MKKTFLIILILVIGFGGIFVLSRALETLKPQPSASAVDDDLYFSANELAAVGHDFRGLIADWYWINSLQYLGGKIVASNESNKKVDINDLKPLNPRLLYPMLDTAATLDPQFLTVYSYGAAVLPAIDNEQAIKLLEKGIAANPDQWRLYNNLGYIYWQTKNYPKAAEIYAEGSTKKDAPVWMKQISASMQAQGGDRNFALQVYRQMYETAEDEQTKNFAKLRYDRVIALNQLDIINSALQNFKQNSNRCANSFSEILQKLNEESGTKKIEFQLDNSRNLVDPTGKPYDFDKDACTAKLSFDSAIPKS